MLYEFLKAVFSYSSSTKSAELKQQGHCRISSEAVFSSLVHCKSNSMCRGRGMYKEP